MGHDDKFFWHGTYNVMEEMGYISETQVDALRLAWDATLWCGVFASGLLYWALGTFNAFGGFAQQRWATTIFGFLKLGVAAALLTIVAFGVPGPYTLVFGVAELFWSLLLFARRATLAPVVPLAAGKKD